MRLDFSRRFSQRAGYYSKYRPAYPNAILHILRREIGFSSKSIVADIGSGTGILTIVFLENGNRVFGFEPADQMRFHAERDLAKFRSFVSVMGTAERTTLKPKSVDLIAVGQALHWFDPPRTIKEFSRISRLGGSLCVVYNNRKNDRFGRAYNEVIGRHHRDNAQVPSPDGKYITGLFEGGRCSTSEVPNEQ